MQEGQDLAEEHIIHDRSSTLALIMKSHAHHEKLINKGSATMLKSMSRNSIHIDSSPHHNHHSKLLSRVNSKPHVVKSGTVSFFV